MTTHTLYRLYDRSGELLYIGSTNDFPRRLNEHKNTKRWGDSIHHWTTDGPHELGHARWLEEEAILAEKPIFNRRRPQNVEVPDEVLRAAINSLPVPESLRELFATKSSGSSHPVAAQAGRGDGGPKPCGEAGGGSARSLSP